MQHFKTQMIFLFKSNWVILFLARYEECGKYLIDGYNNNIRLKWQLLPAVFSSVRISTIPAFGTIMETVTQKEVHSLIYKYTPYINLTYSMLRFI